MDKSITKHRNKRIMKDLYECKNPIIEVSGVGTTVKIDLLAGYVLSREV